MANRERGEVTFEAAGKNWTLRYSTNALCELEAELGKPIMEIVAGLQAASGVSATMLRAVFWAGLQDRQEGLSKKQAGELMTELTLERAGALIGEAMELAFPAPEGGGVDPQKGVAVGSGENSSSSSSSSASRPTASGG